MGAHLDRAIFLYHRSRFDEMQKELHEELAADPEGARAHAYLALCLLGQGKLDGAKAAVGEAVHLAPDMGWVHYVRACVLLREARSSVLTSGFLAALLGSSYDPASRYAPAEAAIREALRLDAFPRAFYFELLGRIHNAQGRTAEALEAVNQGLKVDSQDADCLLLRANLLEQLGRTGEAGEGYRTVLAQAPENADAHRRHGLLLLNERKPDQALEHLREALRLDPNSQEELRPPIVKALKRRHLAYRLASGYLGWLDRAGLAVQLAICGAGVGLGFVVPWLTDRFPAFSIPIQTLYLVFVCLVGFAALAADPLFNLVLRCNRFGRLVLSRDQIAQSTGVAACLGAAALALVTWLLGPRDAFPLTAAVPVLGILVIKFLYDSPRGSWRVSLAAATAAAIAAALAARAVYVLAQLHPLGDVPLLVANGLVYASLGAVLVLLVLAMTGQMTSRRLERRKRLAVRACGYVSVACVAAAVLYGFAVNTGLWPQTWPDLGLPADACLVVACLSWMAAANIASPGSAARKPA